MVKAVFRTSYLYYFSVPNGSKSVCSGAFVADNDTQAMIIAKEVCPSGYKDYSLFRFGRINEYLDNCTVCSDFKFVSEVTPNEP